LRESNGIEGLDHGTDDHLVKPFDGEAEDDGTRLHGCGGMAEVGTPHWAAPG
jgi:hypothetical protein